ncbi:MAG: hypothetical protein IT379_42930, partial [Deltaproteobacteria bacterium]|nr:hypothetical protein [Deltaproteobacteria bacterium]
GAAPPPGNTCRYDGCATDADCGGGICLPPGAIGNLNAACVAAPCRSPADCTRRAGGQCVLARTGGFCPSPAVYCVYDGDPCRTDADCRTPDRAQICVPNPDGHGTRCEDPPPPPP